MHWCGMPPADWMELIKLSRFAGWEKGFIPAVRRFTLRPVAKKWKDRNLPGALHFLTGNCRKRANLFEDTPTRINAHLGQDSIQGR
jgi:hypothetical protein